ISITLARPPTSTLFPYTTLFRSPPPTVARAAPGSHPPYRTSLNPLAVASKSVRRGLATGLTLVAVRDPARLVADPAEEFQDGVRSEEHTSELQSLRHLVCRLLLE